MDFQPEGPKIADLTKPWVSVTYRKYLYGCYKKYFYGANLNPIIVILSGRGCPNRCSYCVIPPDAQRARVPQARSEGRVVDELEYIKKNFEDLGRSIRGTARSPRITTMRAICEDILSRGLKITWSCNARADVPLDLLKLMQKPAGANASGLKAQTP